jgi:hypothetical protein
MYPSDYRRASHSLCLARVTPQKDAAAAEAAGASMMRLT